jgi:hypothetical protein
MSSKIHSIVDIIVAAISTSCIPCTVCALEVIDAEQLKLLDFLVADADEFETVRERSSCPVERVG